MNVLTSVSRTPIYSMEDYPAEKTNHYTLTRNNKQTCKSCGKKKKKKLKVITITLEKTNTETCLLFN